jgi:hypothetical protein
MKQFPSPLGRFLTMTTIIPVASLLSMNSSSKRPITFLTNMKRNFAIYNRIYAEYFAGPRLCDFSIKQQTCYH